MTYQKTMMLSQLKRKHRHCRIAKEVCVRLQAQLKKLRKQFDAARPILEEDEIQDRLREMSDTFEQLQFIKTNMTKSRIRLLVERSGVPDPTPQAPSLDAFHKREVPSEPPTRESVDGMPDFYAH